MLLKFFGNTLNEKHIEAAVSALKHDGVIIIPTDTLYAFAGDIHSHRAMEKICSIKNIRPDKAHFSFLCHDLSNISMYTRPISNEIFRLMKSNLPGPFTYILNANANVPSIFKTKKKTIGIRVPDNEIALAVVEALGNPLMVTSIHSEDIIEEYMTDPDEISARFGDRVDVILDGGASGNLPSTIIDCTSENPVVTREGKM